MLVQEVMTPSPITITPDTTIGESMELMHGHTIRHLPVIEEGKVIGVVSDRDLTFMHSMPRIYTTLHDSDVNAVLIRPITDAMKLRFTLYEDVVTVFPDETIEVAVDKIIIHRLSALPVVDRKSLELVGILSYVDILTVLARIL